MTRSFTPPHRQRYDWARIGLVALALLLPALAANAAIPILDTNLGLTLGAGATATLTSVMLRTTSADAPANGVTYRLGSVPAHGTLKRNNLPLAVGDSFTQDDIDSGRVVYIHDGSATTSDGFSFAVADGAVVPLTRASVSSDGQQGNGDSGPGGPVDLLSVSPKGMAISGNGRYIAFASAASNLVANDTNDLTDVFVYDQQTHQTVRASVGSDGSQANSVSRDTSISADGRYVVFDSVASNLAGTDINNKYDIFVRDMQTGQTSRVSLAPDGAEANGNSYDPIISADGSTVAFTSLATNLAPGSTLGLSNIIVRDLQTGQNTRVTVTTDGTAPLFGSGYAALSADGRYVAYESRAINLVAGDTNNASDVFIYDRQTGQNTRVSVASNDAQAFGDSTLPALSADGRYVAFASTASDLVAGDTNGNADIFIHDRQTGQTTRVSVASDGAQVFGTSYHPSMSADGRYVAFGSRATGLVAGDTNGTGDIFVHDRQTGQTSRITLAADGTQSNGSAFTPVLAADGHSLAFYADASNLVTDDTNGKNDVFASGLGLTAAFAITVTPRDASSSQHTLYLPAVARR